METTSKRIIFLILIALLSGAVQAQEHPSVHYVRISDPRTPDEQQKLFKLPPGFEIQLFASDPDIAKPLNIAFDEQGRLWVAQTRQYPYPSPLDKPGKDEIKILEDTDGDGRADKITSFADGLNIPIGLYPWRGGVLGYSIPRISHYFDRDKDGRVDEIEPLYKTFQYEKDTHGMVNAFRRGFDGWVYGCHGYGNHSTVAGKDGQAITLDEGNTYRFRPDGSHIQQFTWGQTNPYGLTMDPLGNLYSCDSHSKPIYQLLRGGYYEGLGKEDDGLGFAPAMMQHLHNSTAIAGICYYAADQFPPEFRDNIFVGNVNTNRINRDSLAYAGSTPIAFEQPDFVVSDDDWFRPVDIQLGPDGALYVADFYNRIIGHYEVALDHPGRDYQRGRIWRITYRGDGAAPAVAPRRDFAGASVDELISDLAQPNLTVRLLATHQLVDRVGKEAIEPVRRLLRDGVTSAFQRRHALWVLHRLDALDDELLRIACRDPDAGLRVHSMRVLSETSQWTAEHRGLALEGLNDTDGLVRRCAADALGQHPHGDYIRPLLSALHQASPHDTHLLHVLRMAVRNQLRPAGSFAQLAAIELSQPDIRAIADVSLSIANSDAAAFLISHADQLPQEPAALKKAYRHIARHAPANSISPLVAQIRERFAADLDLQLELFDSIRMALAEKDQAPANAFRTWGSDLVRQILPNQKQSQDWTNHPLERAQRSDNPWTLQPRPSSDGDGSSPFITSLPSERLTGVLRSRPFEVPPKLTMYVAGHSGPPEKNEPPKNLLRLRDAQTHETLIESTVPRNDVAQPVSWELQQFAGRQGYLEIIDGDDGDSYAWIAFGRLDPPVVPLPSESPSTTQRRLRAALDIVGQLRLTDWRDVSHQFVTNEQEDPEIRAAAGAALIAIAPDDAAGEIGRIVASASAPLPLRETLADALGRSSSPDARKALSDAIQFAPQRLQTRLAIALSSSREGASELLDAVRKSKAPAQLLLEQSVRDRLGAAGIADLDMQIEELTRGLSPPSEKIRELIENHRASFLSSSSASPEAGAKVFAANCIVCHQVAGAGNLVGPQLDGIGNRGLDRLLEDIIDPNRNVDAAFRYHIVTLNDGKVLTGLPRREDGQLLILVDATGKEIQAPLPQIEKRTESRTSLMPGNFHEIISGEDFNHLLAYMLSLAETKGP